MEALIVVQSRDQKAMRVLTVDPDTGATRVRRQDTDPCWVQIVPGVPALTTQGSFVWTADLDGTRRLLVDDLPVTPPGLNIREVLGLADDNVVAAHTLRLSAALTAAGRPHTVLPLPGVTHMTPQTKSPRICWSSRPTSSGTHSPDQTFEGVINTQTMMGRARREGVAEEPAPLRLFITCQL